MKELLQLLLEYIEEYKQDNILPLAIAEYEEYCLGLCQVCNNMYFLHLLHKEQYKLLLEYIETNRPPSKKRLSWEEFNAKPRITWIRKEINKFN